MRYTAGWFAGYMCDWFGPGSAPAAPGSGPEGVGVFSLDLDNGYTVTYRWASDVIKLESGREQRRGCNTHPKEFYSGSALLFGDAPASLRAQLARYAAQGQPFTLGLPHEEMSFRAAAQGTTVYVHDTTASDWMNAGQRVIVRRDRESLQAVIQSTTADSITLDVAPGALGGIGGTIMPSVAILLEPEQAFPRYPTEAERWNIEARAAVFGFAATRATLALGPITTSAAFDNVTIEARTDGAAGNDLRFSLVNSLLLAGQIAESNGDTSFAFAPGVTTLGELATALASSAYVRMAGTYNPADTIAAGDAFSLTALTGGVAGGAQGTGATVTTHAGKPVWDRELVNLDTIIDSIQAMTEILDFDGVPDAVGSWDYADWGRAVVLEAPLGDEWQWFKLFMATVVGRQKVFWLPTWRDDLPCISTGAGTITVDADVGAWWPSQRYQLQIQHAGGLGYYAITAATDNGDGTWTLTIGATLSGVEMVSWLELARWTQDDIVVQFDSEGFKTEITATVVQQ